VPPLLEEVPQGQRRVDQGKRVAMAEFAAFGSGYGHHGRKLVCYVFFGTDNGKIENPDQRVRRLMEHSAAHRAAQKIMQHGDREFRTVGRFRRRRLKPAG